MAQNHKKIKSNTSIFAIILVCYIKSQLLRVHQLPPNPTFWSVLALQGATGAQGIKGNTGNTGPQGPTGASNALSIGTVVAGASAGATITGTAPNQILNLTLPQGPKGDAGLSVIDGNGNTIGAYLGISANSGDIMTVLINNLIYQINTSRAIWSFPSVTLYYSDLDCSGIVYTNRHNLLPQRLFLPAFNAKYENGSDAGQPLYKSSAEMPVMTQYKSYFNEFPDVQSCKNTAGTILLSPAVQVGVVPADPIGPFVIR